MHSAVRTTLLGLACVSLLVLQPTTSSAKKSSIEPLTAEGLPNVQSDGAVAIDVDTGEIIYGKNPDKVRDIASTSKIFVAMVVRKHKVNLEGKTEITDTDADFARGGSRTRLDREHRFKNVDLLRAMLIASDNRAPTALGRAVGLSPDKLVAEMNVLAKELGLSRTHFVDPSGLNGNESTAREMAKALRAAFRDPLLAEIMGTRTAEVTSIASRPRRISYRNTNKSLHSPRYQVHGGKTGFTDEAGYCLVIAADVADRRMVMSFLGAREKLTRFGDFGRVVKWLRSQTADIETASR